MSLSAFNVLKLEKDVFYINKDRINTLDSNDFNKLPFLKPGMIIF